MLLLSPSIDAERNFQYVSSGDEGYTSFVCICRSSELLKIVRFSYHSAY